MTDGRAELLATSLLAVEEELEREFEARLADSSTLAFRIAHSVLRHREDAEDVAQEALTKAHRRLHQLRDRNRFRSWLVRITWRLAIDRQRANRRRRWRTAELAAETAGGEEPSHERATELWAAIDALPQKLRLVLVLSVVEGHDVAGLSRLLGVPQGTVKSRLYLARQRLKDVMRWTRTSR